MEVSHQLGGKHTELDNFRGCMSVGSKKSTVKILFVKKDITGFMIRMEKKNKTPIQILLSAVFSHFSLFKTRVLGRYMLSVGKI